jgi:hypothetical protein
LHIISFPLHLQTYSTSIGITFLPYLISIRSLRKSLLLIYCLFLSHFSNSQNLLSNSSFEDTTSHGGACFGTIDWVISWFNPTASTPDLYCYNSTSANCIISSINNPNGYQLPRTGNSYAGIYTYAGPTRDYLATQLVEPLSLGCIYLIEFYISRANTYGLATDKIGCAFSPDTIGFNSTSGFLSLTPAIETPPGVLITDTQNWIHVTGVYTAIGNEQYFLIGNFHDDLNTYVDTANIALYYSAYYYVDDVKILACDSTQILQTNFLTQPEITVFPNPSSDFIYIICDNPTLNVQFAELLETSGKRLQRQKLRSDRQQNILSVADVKSGYYLIKIISENANPYYSEIIIIH